MHRDNGASSVDPLLERGPAVDDERDAPAGHQDSLERVACMEASMLANGRNRWRRAGVTGIDHFARPVGVAGREGRGAEPGAEVENVRPDRVGLRGHRCRTVEHRLEWKLTSVAHDPDWPGLGDLSLEPVAFAAVFTGDGHSHRPCRVALPLRRTTPPHVATRILASNESPTSFTPRREEGVEAPAANRLRGRLRRCALATGERSTPSPADAPMGCQASSGYTSRAT